MSTTSASAIAPDTKGQNFYQCDRTLTQLAQLYLEPELLAVMESQLEKLGHRAANDLDDHAALANKHTPVLHHRDKFGQDRQRVEYHPSYRSLEKAAFGDYAIHAMSHRPTLDGWDQALPVVAKHLHTFLFNQTEFGLGCPINVTDSSIHLIREFGDESTKAKLLPRMLTNDTETLWQGAQFITEQEGGSDVGQLQTIARQKEGEWRLTGEKWFCSNVDAQIAMVLARPEGAPEGTKGLALFAMPRTLEDGSPNNTRIVRLKDKLGTRSMASGEIAMDSALAYLIGNPKRGFHQMAEMINWSRLSNGVKSSALMRRAVHDALAVSTSREVFGSTLMELPLGKRQLLKLMLPSEQSMSVWAWVASQMDLIASNSPGSNEASKIVRLATPVLKMRASRDARKVCGDAMEVRGGCGYIEDFVNPRLVRDAFLGSIWEGTSNIVAIDVVRRAIARSDCLPPYIGALRDLTTQCSEVVPQFALKLSELLTQTEDLCTQIALDSNEELYRQATSVLYHATSAVLMAWEGVELERRTGDASRLLWSQLVVQHKLSRVDPFAVSRTDSAINDWLLRCAITPLEDAVKLVE